MNTGIVTALAVLLGIMIGAWVLSGKRKNNSSAKEFDEMQLLIRAKGYRLAFLTALILLAVLVLLLELNLLEAVTPAFAVFGVLMISVTVFAIYCIRHDAFLGIREKSKNTVILFSVIVVVEIVNTVRSLVRGELLEDGRLTFCGGSPVLLGAAFLILLITLMVETARGRKEAAE